MANFVCVGLLCLALLSSIALVNAIKGYRTDFIDDYDRFYLNFYLNANSTKSSKGYAEFCNYTNDNTCFDTSDSAPMYKKKTDLNSSKVLYSFVYPPHNKTKRQLTVLVNYDPKYTENATGKWTVNDNEMVLEYQWTKDKISSHNMWRLMLAVSNSAENQSSHERLEKATNLFALGMALLNLVIAFCAFFGSLNPRCCLALIFIILIIQLMQIVPKARWLEIIIPVVIFLAINFKQNPLKRFIFVVLGMMIWEIWYYKEEYKQLMILGVSGLLTFVYLGVSLWLTKDCKNKVAIISSAYIGSLFPFIIFYAIFMDSLPSLFPYMLASRHIVAFAGVTFQAKVLSNFEEFAKIPEEVSLLGNKRAVNLNDTHALTNSLL